MIYCQQRGIGKIANCLEVGSYDRMEEVVVDNALLGDVADPHKVQRDLYMELKKSAYAEFRTYMRSKEQLLGIIKSMTDKPLGEKTIRCSKAKVPASPKD